MKINALAKYILGGIILAIVVGFLFVQFVYIDGVNYSFINMLSNGFSWPLLLIILAYLLLISGTILLIFSDKYKWIPITSLLILALGGILFCFSNGFYAYGIDVDEELVRIGVTPIILAIICFLLAVYANALVLKDNAFSVSDIVEIALFVALAIGIDRLEFLKIRVVATGGSINIAMLPLMIIALRHNLVKTFIASGIVYGFSTCILDGWGLIYFPFDYLLGFGCVCILSIFRKLVLPPNSKKITYKGILFMIIGVILVIIARTTASSLSSMIYYGYSLGAALIYNLSYIPASCLLSLVGLIILYKPLLIVNHQISMKHQALN